MHTQTVMNELLACHDVFVELGIESCNIHPKHVHGKILDSSCVVKAIDNYNQNEVQQMSMLLYVQIIFRA